MRTSESAASSNPVNRVAPDNRRDSRCASLAILALLALVFSSPYAIPVFWVHIAEWMQLAPTENPGFLPSPLAHQTWYVIFGSIAVFLPVAFLGLLHPIPKPDPLIAATVAGLFVAAGLSALITPGIRWAYSDLFILCAFALIFLTALMARPTVAILNKMSILAVITAVPIALVALAQNAGYDPFPYSATMPGSLDIVEGKHVVASVFGHPNYMGSFLAPVMVLILPLCMSGKNYVTRGIAAAGAILCLWALLIGGTRGPLLALACGVAIYLLMLPRRTFAFKTLAKAFGAAAVVYIIGAIFFPGLRPGFEIGDRILGSKEIASRAFYWRVGLHAFSEHPVLGIGPGQFDKLFWQNIIETPGTAPGEPWYFVLADVIRGVRPGQMHNDHLQVLVEVGMVGAVFWAGLWTMIVRKSLTLRKAVISYADASYNAALAATFGVFFVDALFNFPLHLPCSGALFWALAGIYAIWNPKCRDSPQPSVARDEP